MNKEISQLKNEVQSVEFKNIKFNNVDLVCILINTEPYILLDHIINDIGLNAKSSKRTLINNDRFNNYLITITVRTKGTIRYLSVVKNCKNEPFFTLKGTDSVPFENLLGYKFSGLPVRKFAAWIYSIETKKVQKDVRPILELYQEQCDDVLYSYFLGDESRRKKLLLEKRVIESNIHLLEKHLIKNETYVKILESQNQLKNIKDQLKKIDDSVQSSQYILFQ